MNIGVLGWWHHDNQGDSRLLDCITRALAPHRVVPIELPFSANKDSLRRLNLLDFVILGGGGLFQSAPVEPFDRFDSWQHELRTPIGVAGLGIDQILPQHLPAVLALAERARFFFVRDRTSQQLVGHAKVQVAPDLSFLYPQNLAPGGRASPSSHLCGVNLRRLGDSKTDGWIDQWVRTLKALPMRLRGIPFTVAAYQEVQTLQCVDESCAQDFAPSLYAGLGMFIGMAFHSVLFSIQAGVPAIAIAYAPKTRRLMADIGLEDYCLELDEWQKLPKLVERVMSQHGELVAHLTATTTSLETKARHVMAGMVREIEESAPAGASTSSVSIIVLGSESDERNQRTLDSCLDQTHTGVEVVFSGATGSLSPIHPASDGRLTQVTAAQNENVADRLNRAISCSTGQYLSWVTAGDVLARDTIACLADRLDRDARSDLVYAACYRVDDHGFILDALPWYSSDKLFRTNVVGSCFLYRRALGDALGPLDASSRLADYDYWLRAHHNGNLACLPVWLLYVYPGTWPARHAETERLVRRRWRSTRSWPSRLVWRLLDTDFAERYLVQPVLKSLRAARAAGKGRRRRAQRAAGQEAREI